MTTEPMPVPGASAFWTIVGAVAFVPTKLDAATTAATRGEDAVAVRAGAATAARAVAAATAAARAAERVGCGAAGGPGAVRAGSLRRALAERDATAASRAGRTGRQRWPDRSRPRRRSRLSSLRRPAVAAVISGPHSPDLSQPVLVARSPAPPPPPAITSALSRDHGRAAAAARAASAGRRVVAAGAAVRITTLPRVAGLAACTAHHHRLSCAAQLLERPGRLRALATGRGRVAAALRADRRDRDRPRAGRHLEAVRAGASNVQVSRYLTALVPGRAPGRDARLHAVGRRRGPAPERQASTPSTPAEQPRSSSATRPNRHSLGLREHAAPPPVHPRPHRAGRRADPRADLGGRARSRRAAGGRPGRSHPAG